MGLRNWAEREWNDIKGNAKWEFYKKLSVISGALVIATTYALWRAIQHERVEPYLFGILLLVSMMLFYVSSRRTQPGVILPEDLPKLLPEVRDPQKANLKTEILEILFLLRRQSISNNIFALLKVRVVNHGAEEAVVTNWDLGVEVGGGKLSSREHEIEPNWQIRRIPPIGPITMEVVDKDASTFAYPLKKGVPKSRWICFELFTIPNKILPPHNAKFILTLTDAFGQDHVSDDGPGFAFDSGELVEI